MFKLKRQKAIDPHSGSGVMLLGCLMGMMALLLTILFVEYSNHMYADTLSVSRGDMIADSAAVYAQSYDYAYNQNQARIMTSLLTDLNNGTSGAYEFATTLSFPSDDVLSVQCIAKVPSSYSSLTGTDYYYSTHSSSIKSVDVYGDIFVVPETR